MDTATINPENETPLPTANETDRKKFNPTVLFHNLSVWTVFASQLVVTVAYLFGAVTAFGENVHLISAFSAIINVFGMNEAVWYRYLFLCGFGILYLVLLGFLIKNTVYVCWHVKDGLILKSRNSAATTAEKRTAYAPYSLYLKDSCRASYELVVIFCVLSNLMSENILSGGLVFLMVFGSLTRIAVFVFDVLKSGKKVSLQDAITETAGVALSCVFVCLVINALSAYPAGYEFVRGVTLLFRGQINANGGTNMLFYGIYAYLIAPVLLISLVIAYLVYFHNRFFVGAQNDVLTKRGNVNMLVFSGVLLLMHIVFNCILIQKFTFSVLSGPMMKEVYLPLLFLNIAITVYFQFFRRKVLVAKT